MKITLEPLMKCRFQQHTAVSLLHAVDDACIRADCPLVLYIPHRTMPCHVFK